MARIRTIKPEFFASETLCTVPEITHFFAASLLCYADDDGYFNANPSLIKAAAFPLREPSVSVHDMLMQLSTLGYLRLGTGPDGRRYGQIVNFSDHQRINRKTDSKIKQLRIVWDNASTPHEPLSEPSHPEGNGREQGMEGNIVELHSTPSAEPPEEKRNGTPTRSDQAVEVFQFWQKTMGKPRAQFTPERVKLVTARLRDGYTPQDLKKAVWGCSITPHNAGHNDRDQRFDDLALICRDGGHVDRFMGNAERPPALRKAEA